MRKSTLIITSAAGAAVLVGGAAAYASVAATPDATPDLASTSTASGATPRNTAQGTPDELDAAIAAALDEVGPGTVLEADVDDDASHAYEIDIRLDAGGAVEVRLDADLAVVSVSEDDAKDAADDASDDAAEDSTNDDLVPDEAARQKAEDAALAHVGEGTVVSVELSDDADHVYEVEIDLGDGKDVDVELDADFAVVKAD